MWHMGDNVATEMPFQILAKQLRHLQCAYVFWSESGAVALDKGKAAGLSILGGLVAGGLVWAVTKTLDPKRD